MLRQRDVRDWLAHLPRLSDSLCAPESLLCWLGCGSLGLLRLRSPLLIDDFFCPTAEPAHPSKQICGGTNKGCNMPQHMQEACIFIDSTLYALAEK